MYFLKAFSQNEEIHVQEKTRKLGVILILYAIN